MTDIPTVKALFEHGRVSTTGRLTRRRLDSYRGNPNDEGGYGGKQRPLIAAIRCHSAEIKALRCPGLCKAAFALR